MRTTVLIAALAAGCVGGPDESTNVTVQENRDGCPGSFCGSNSDVIVRNNIWEANLHGAPDQNGVALRSRPGTKSTQWWPRAQIWAANGTAYDLRVVNNRISGTAISGTGGISGNQLVGAKIVFQWNGFELYTVKITKVRQIPILVGNLEWVEAYTMKWYPAGSTVPTSTCAVDPSQPKEAYGLWNDETVVFEGDRIKPDTLTMSRNEEWNPSWFTLGCTGSVPAKLRMTRKTQGTQPYPQDWRMRQAALKMLTADYCAEGNNFTKPGIPISWADREGIVNYDITGLPPVNQIEARWNENGATCLSGTRADPTGQYRLVDLVAQECGTVENPLYLAPCYDTVLTTPPLDDFRDSLIITAIPR